MAIDRNTIKRYHLSERPNKEHITDSSPKDLGDLIQTDEFSELSQIISDTIRDNRTFMVSLGGHVIKLGLARYLIDLIRKGYISSISMNGSVVIHDFEVAYQQMTSEDVLISLEDGTYGMAIETADLLNNAIKDGAAKGLGYGQSIAEMMASLDLPHRNKSLLMAAYDAKIPITVHVAIGTDIIHMHPSCDGAAIGKTSYQDFLTFADMVSQLDQGVYLNIGSNVLMPEVFLKAVAMVRNMGYDINHITTANFDMIKHYRPLVNIVQRPAAFGGRGFYITERHEKTIPSLYHNIITALSD